MITVKFLGGAKKSFNSEKLEISKSDISIQDLLELLLKRKPDDTSNFDVENKKALNEIAIVRSKGLKNKVAGYITRFIKKEIREDKIKHDRSGMDYSNVEEQESKLEITESGEIDESGEEITLTNEEVETIVSSTPSADDKTE